MLGSSNSIACANIMLNTAVAESLRIYADRLEHAEDFETALHEMIRKTIKDHKHILTETDMMKIGSERQRKNADFSTIALLPMLCRIFLTKKMWIC